MLNLRLTLESGQTFIYYTIDEMIVIINGNDVMMLTDDLKMFESYNDNIKKFFRLDDDIELINSSINKDKIIGEAISHFKGLRILRQDPFQALISFICSSNTSIRNIKMMLNNLVNRFGERIEWNGYEFRLFPSVDRLARAEIDELRSCGLGFRAVYVRDASKMVLNMLDFEELKSMDYNEAKAHLMILKGVGDKIADCVLLFALEHLESFPIDRWIWRILSSYGLDTKNYKIASENMRSYFGRYAGYAQQYLYCYARMFY
ncbi:MAG: DNA glycosylase [Candidatus Nitrosocaldaceae archaeon]